MDNFYAEKLWQKAKEQWLICDNDPAYAKILTAFSYGVNHVPKGYVLVPVEPTEKMFKAGLGWRESDSELEGEYRMVYESYKAMIQAAQEEE
jgi:hypothetical protein